VHQVGNQYIVIIEGKFNGKNIFETCLNCKMQDKFIHFKEEKCLMVCTRHYLLALCNMMMKICT